MAENTDGVFGGYVANEIIEQIKVRQDIRGLGAGLGDKVGEDLEVDTFNRKWNALYQNTPWIRLMSGVNTPDTPFDYKKQPKTSSTLAKKYVLCGGTLRYDAEKDKYYYQQEDGLVGYSLDKTFGYRPMPGITKISVKTKDTFGCIMEATVDITCWTLEDLEALDKIYFKPGMMALLEWGHTIYVNNKGEVVQTPLRYKGQQFFEKKLPFDRIDKGLQDIREAADGNYEAVFGFITNFSWSFNANGSYSCTVTIASKGTVLEGLQLPASSCLTGPKHSEEVEKEEGEEDESESTKTVFHVIFEDMRQMIKVQDKNDGWYGVDAAGKVICKSNEGKSTEDVSKFIVNGCFSGTTIQAQPFIANQLYHNYWGGLWGSKKSQACYITLNSFLAIVNEIYRQQGTGVPVPYVPFETDREDGGSYKKQPYVSFKEHFSLDPGKVLLPTKPCTDYTGDRGKIFQYSSDKREEKTLEQYLEKLYVPAVSSQPLDEENVIGNIWLSVDFIQSCVDATVDEETGNYKIGDIINNVLAGMQAAMGNINSFGIHINHVANTATIVDRNCISSTITDNIEALKVPIIVSGPKTTVTNFSVKSEVSSEMSSEMSVAATTPVDGLGSIKAGADLVFWNEGCQNRHYMEEDESAAGEKPFKGNITFSDGRKYEIKTPEDQALYREWKTLLNAYNSEDGKLDKKGREENSARRAEILDELARNQVERTGNVSPFYRCKDFLEKATSLYEVLVEQESQDKDTVDQGITNYSGNQFAELQVDGEDVFTRCKNRDLLDSEETTGGHFQAGLIPVKVGLTMQGIGRFVVGTAFRISNGLFPKKYDDWGHIIVGVSHDVDSKGWTTTLETQYYPVVKQNRKPTGGGSFSSIAEGGGSEGSYTYNDEVVDNGVTKTPKNAVENWFMSFWKKSIPVPGGCAGYVCKMCKSWVSGKVATEGGWGDAGSVTGPGFGTSKWVDFAKALGYKVVYHDTVSIKDLDRTIIANQKEDGYVAVYYIKTFGNGKSAYRQNIARYDNGEGSCMHVQIKVPHVQIKTPVGTGYKEGSQYRGKTSWDIASKASTSTPNNYFHEGSVYGVSKAPGSTWELYVLRPPQINAAWNKA